MAKRQELINKARQTAKRTAMESTLHMALRLRGGASMRFRAEPFPSSASGSSLVPRAIDCAGASCGGGSRRPYRWWADRRLVAENAVWGAQALAWERRVARGCDDERWWQKSDQAWAAACAEWRFDESVRAAVREARRRKTPPYSC